MSLWSIARTASTSPSTTSSAKKGNAPANQNKGNLTPTESQKKRAAQLQSNDYKQRLGPFVGSRIYLRQMKKRWKGTAIEQGCKPTLGSLASQDLKFGGLSGRQVGSWLCNYKGLIRFKEKNYANQHNEFRLFIQGAEVSHYVEGAISWSTESTEGMNTCRFTLNNNHDAFIITPENICAGTKNVTGWRMPGAQKGKGINPMVFSPFRRNFRTDEIAKYIIYKNKYDMVNPEGAYPSIDPVTRMWVYPLAHYHCIFNKHDPVRLFIHLPHIGGEVYKQAATKYDLWMPTFTGFIKDYSWTDDPVTGQRKVSITCYDIRGIMERMRVQINAGPARAEAGGPEDTKDLKKKDIPKGLAKLAWMNPATQEARKCTARLTKKFGASAMPPSYRAIKNDPLTLAKKIGVQTLFDKLNAVAWEHALLVGKGACKTPASLKIGHSALDPSKGTAFLNCARDAYNDSSATVGAMYRAVINGLCELMDAAIELYNLTGKEWVINANTPKRAVMPSIAANIQNATNQALLAQLSLIPVFSAASNQNAGDNSAINAIDAVRKNTVSERDAFLDAAVLYAITHFKWQAETNRGLLRAGWAILSALLNKFWGKFIAGLGTGAVTSLKDAITLKTTEYKSTDLKQLATAAKMVMDNQYEKIVAPVSKNKYLTATVLTQSYRSTGEQFSEALYGPRRKITAIIKSGTLNDLIIDALLTQAAGGTKLNTGSIEAKLGPVFAQLREIVNVTLRDILIARAKIVQEKFEFWAESTSAAGLLSNSVSPWKTQKGNLLVTTAPGVATRIRANLVCDAFLGQHKSRVYKKSVVKLRRGGIVGVAVGGVPLQFGMDKAVYVIMSKIGQAATVTNANANQLQYLDKVVAVVQQWRTKTELNKGKKKGTQKRGGFQSTTYKTQGERFGKYPRFLDKALGVFQDIKEAQFVQPHPLMGKSFEEAVRFLIETNTNIRPTRWSELRSYNDTSELTKFNTTVLFGVLGRPLTFAEVTQVGLRTTSRLDSVFNPLNVFYHMLLPKNGTGASTILKKDTGGAGPSLNATQINYSTRKDLMDEICSSLDMQWYVSGWGDIVVEIPHYNAYPRDFGINYKDAYTFKRDWISATIAEEGKDIPTAWMFTGLDAEKKLERALLGFIPAHQYKTKLIMAPILARRLGAKTEHINLKIPGLGAITDADGKFMKGKSATTGLDQLAVYAYFYVQRQVGRAHTLNITNPFRPYIVPNRPIWLVHRQRIGLTSSVTHTMTPPDGVCTTDVSLNYVRWLNRDGSFRFMAGGDRQIIDYVQFFSGTGASELVDTLVGKNATYDTLSRRNNGTRYNATATANMAARNPYTAAVGNAYGQAFTPKAPDGTNRNASDYAQIRRAGFMPEVEDQKQPAATGLDQKNLTNYFYDGAAFGAKNSNLADFGLIRAFNKKRIYKTTGLLWHNGVDLIVPVGTTALAPVDIDWAQAHLRVVGMNKVKGDGGARVTKQVSNLQPGSQYIIDNFRAFRYTKKGAKATAFPIENAGPTNIQWTTVYWDAWQLYQKVTKGVKAHKLLVKWPGGSGGLMLFCNGWVKPPNVPSGATNGTGKLRAQLVYVHMSNLTSIGDKVLGVHTTSVGRGRALVKATDPVGKTGNSFGYAPHLHFELGILRSSKNDLELLKLAVAMNKEFLTQQLYARATGWTYNKASTDPYSSVRSTKYAASFWQKKGAAERARLKLPKTGKLTAKQVADALKKQPGYKYKNTGMSKIDLYTSMKLLNEFKKGKVKVMVNPAHYFKVEELVDLSSLPAHHKLAKGSKNLRVRQGRDPSEKRWCGLYASALLKTVSAKNTKATVKSKRQTAANPANAAANTAKLKKTVARNNQTAKTIQKKAVQGRKDPIKGAKEAHKIAKRAMRNSRQVQRHEGAAAGAVSAVSSATSNLGVFGF